MSDNIVVPQSPTSPGVIVTDKDHHGYHHRGLEGKDATFFLQNNLSDGVRSILRELSDNKAATVEARLEAQLKTVDSMHNIIRETHANNVAIEKNNAEVKALVIEKQKEVIDLIKDMECQRLKDENTRLRMSLSTDTNV